MIRSISLFVALLSYQSSAFQPIGFHRPARNVALRVSSEVEKEAAPIIITGRNIELTPALVDYVNKRIGGPLKKLASNGAIRECDVHLSVSKNPKVKDAHRVEITANLKGTSFHAKEESPDMYTSIDNIAAGLSRKLRRYKERRMEGWHGGGPMAEDIMEVLDIMDKDLAESEVQVQEEYVDDFSDPGAPTITKIKSFDLEKPISLQEAIFALDYTDHDFYVFRDAETNEISVVYKRNAGGIGLVQP